ncbi:MAG: hypothetical protein C0594_10060 [Marinilabiliales bacterium]|nr:MAG: hypothetical protein C0594_10060 [Marinilabiliales bacterium]
MLKRLFAMLVIVSILVMYLGNLVVFNYHLYCTKTTIKTKIKNGIPNDELVELIITKNTEKNHKLFNRIDGHEFRYRGVMYDVIEYQEFENYTKYKCLTDEKETVLFHTLREKAFKSMQKDPLKSLTIRSIQKLLNVNCVLSAKAKSMIAHRVFRHGDIPIKGISEPYLMKITPPPQCSIVV